MISPKALCQIEFKSKDPPKTLSFFESVLGWSVLPITLQDYFVIEVPEESSFGISVSPCSHQDDPSAQSTLFFRCEEPLEIIIQRIEAYGGQIIDGPKSVPAYGKAMKIREPGGIVLGLFIPHAEPILANVE